MIEPRNDMLPDKSETNQEVEETKIPMSKQDEKIESEEQPIEETLEEEPKTEIPKGYVPYDALHAERQKRKELEQKLKELPTNNSDDEVFSDEGLALKKQIDALKNQITSYEKKEQESKVYSAYPILNDRREEFEEYLEENSELSLDKAAKLFMLDNNLVAQKVPERKGLEKPTGGSRTAPKKGYSEADIKRLRETEPRKYIKLIRSGAINPDEIGQ